MSTATPEERAAWIAGMRQLLDALEANPDLPLPMDGVSLPLLFSLKTLFRDDDARKAMAALETALPAEYAASIDDRGPLAYKLEGVAFGAVKVEISAYAEHVAERRVLGTRTVEDVEWVRLPAGPEAAEGDDSPEAQS